MWQNNISARRAHQNLKNLSRGGEMWPSALAARRIQIGGMLRVAAEFHVRHGSNLGGRIKCLQEAERHSREWE